MSPLWRCESLLRILAFLEPSCIEEAIFEEWVLPLPAQDLLGESSEYKSARTTLLQASLIEHNEEDNTITVNSLVQTAVKAQLSAEDTANIFWNTVCNLAIQWPSAREAPSKKTIQSTPPKTHSVCEWPKREMLYHHVLQLKETWENRFKDESTTYDIQWAGLLADAAWWRFERGYACKFDDLYGAAVKICDRSDDPDKEPLMVDMCLGIAAIAAETNAHPSSRKLKSQALDLQLKYLDGTKIEDSRLSRCYVELAIALIQDREYDNAIPMLWRGVDIKTHLGLFSALAYANLGLVHIFQGKYDAAEDILSFALSMQEKSFGKMDSVSFRTGRVLYAYGNLRAAQGRFVESLTYHQWALKQFRSTIGDSHHRTADICHKVAEDLIRFECYKDAMSMIDQALETWGLDPGVYQPEIARTTYLKGQLLKVLKEDEEADRLIEKATAILTATASYHGTSGSQADALPSSKDFDSLVTFWSR